MKFASPEWVDGNFPPGGLGVMNLFDGSDSRDVFDKTCYHTMDVAARSQDYGKPFANFSITNPMKVERVEVLTRHHPGHARNPLSGIISLQVLTCNGLANCSECSMEDKDSLSDDTAWVHFTCDNGEANQLVLTNDYSYHIIACELQAFGYPRLPKLS